MGGRGESPESRRRPEGGSRPLREGLGLGRARGLQLGSTVSGCARRGRAGEARRGLRALEAARPLLGAGGAEARRGRALNGSVSRCGRGLGQAALQQL